MLHCVHNRKESKVLYKQESKRQKVATNFNYNSTTMQKIVNPKKL